jgi:hypothetical protein
MIYLSLALLVILGMASTVLNTVVGGGGGLILIPLLILAFNQTANSAIATSFTVLAVGALASTFAYSRQGRIDYAAGLMLAVLTLPGIIAGAFLTASLPSTLFNTILGIVTCILATPMFLSRPVDKKSVPRIGWVRKVTDSSDTIFSYAINRKIAIPSAIATGFFVGIFGAGGGLIFTPLMVMAGFPIHVALATVRLIVLVFTIGGAVTRFSLGQMQVDLALWLCIGGVAGAFVGARLALLASNKLLTRVVAISVLVLGIVLVVQSQL